VFETNSESCTSIFDSITGIPYLLLEHLAITIMATAIAKMTREKDLFRNTGIALNRFVKFQLIFHGAR
jgi:hypothetical protein